MSKQVYALFLDDYSCPSCCSGIKTYYGTLEEIKTFIDRLEATNGHGTTVKAFRDFCNGNTEVTHGIAYIWHPLMRPVKVLQEFSTKLDHPQWEYINPYGCPYEVKADTAFVKAMLVKDEDKYYRCLQAGMLNLSYFDDFDTKNPWHPLDGGFWGHPEMMNVKRQDKDFTVESRLYIKETQYDSKADALAQFESDPINFAHFSEDIFGDG